MKQLVYPGPKLRKEWKFLCKSRPEIIEDKINDQKTTDVHVDGDGGNETEDKEGASEIKHIVSHKEIDRKHGSGLYKVLCVFGCYRVFFLKKIAKFTLIFLHFNSVQL